MKHSAFVFVLMLTLFLSCDSADKKSTSYIISRLSINDLKLPKAKPGDWLYEHKESGQNFTQYIAENPVRITKELNSIYLLPIGDFNSFQYKMIDATAEFLTIFFNTKVNIETAIPNNSIPDSAQRHFGDHIQFNGTYVLRHVIKINVPKDAIARMGFTTIDIYPRNSWNFVFGLASYKERVGVTSLYRLFGNDIDTVNYQLGLSRLIKIAAHETGHIFSLHHCTQAQCLMNGSNSMIETDNKPNRLCSECTAKLMWNLKFDETDRLKKLQDFFEKYGLQEENRLITKDLKQLE